MRLALLELEDLDEAWTNLEDRREWDADELRSQLLAPCGRSIEAAIGTSGAESIAFFRPDGVTLRQSVLAQHSTVGRAFIDDTDAAAGDCADGWPVAAGSESVYTPLNAPNVVRRGDRTSAFAAEWSAADGRAMRTAVVQILCAGRVTRLAVSHPIDTDDADAIVDDLARTAYLELRQLGQPVPLCSSWQPGSWPPAATQWDPFDRRTLADRPIELNALAATNWAHTLPTVEADRDENFWDADRNGDVDLLDIGILMAMWVLQPDALAAAAPNEEIRSVILLGRELIDATPIGACVNAGLHLLRSMEGQEDLSLAELVGCGTVILSNIGGAALRSLKPLGGTRWATAIDDTARFVDDGGLNTPGEMAERIALYRSNEAQASYYQRCGVGEVVLLGVQARAACVALPALADD